MSFWTINHTLIVSQSFCGTYRPLRCREFVVVRCTPNQEPFTYPMIANFSWFSGASRSRPEPSPARTVSVAPRVGRRMGPSLADFAWTVTWRAGTATRGRTAPEARTAAEAKTHEDAEGVVDIVTLLRDEVLAVGGGTFCYGDRATSSTQTLFLPPGISRRAARANIACRLSSATMKAKTESQRALCALGPPQGHLQSARCVRVLALC